MSSSTRCGREENPTDFGCSRHRQEHSKSNTDHRSGGRRNPTLRDWVPIGAGGAFITMILSNKGTTMSLIGQRDGGSGTSCSIADKYFTAWSGDEHIDLGGDAYIASNFSTRHQGHLHIGSRLFERDLFGDKGANTPHGARTSFRPRPCDNCKVDTATVFEHNTGPTSTRISSILGGFLKVSARSSSLYP